MANFRWVFSIAKYLLPQFTSYYFLWQTWSYPDNLLSAVTFWPITFSVTDNVGQPMGTVGGIFKPMLALKSLLFWSRRCLDRLGRDCEAFVMTRSDLLRGRSLHFLWGDLGCTWTYHFMLSDFRNLNLLLDNRLTNQLAKL